MQHGDAVGLGMDICYKWGGTRATWPRRSKEQKWFFLGEMQLVRHWWLFSHLSHGAHSASNSICYFKVTEEAGISSLPSHRGQLLSIGGNGILIYLLLSRLIPVISKGWHFSQSRLQNSNEMRSTMTGQSWLFLWWYLEMRNYNIPFQWHVGAGTYLKMEKKKCSPFQEEHLTICKRSG